MDIIIVVARLHLLLGFLRIDIDLRDLIVLMCSSLILSLIVILPDSYACRLLNLRGLGLQLDDSLLLLFRKFTDRRLEVRRRGLSDFADDEGGWSVRA